VLTPRADSRLELLTWVQIALLRRMVEKAYLALPIRAREATTPKIPWKKVSDWMKAGKASYCFAAGPCAKKAKECKIVEDVQRRLA